MSEPPPEAKRQRGNRGGGEEEKRLKAILRELNSLGPAAAEERAARARAQGPNQIFEFLFNQESGRWYIRKKGIQNRAWRPVWSGVSPNQTPATIIPQATIDATSAWKASSLAANLAKQPPQGSSSSSHRTASRSPARRAAEGKGTKGNTGKGKGGGQFQAVPPTRDGLRNADRQATTDLPKHGPPVPAACAAAVTVKAACAAAVTVGQPFGPPGTSQDSSVSSDTSEAPSHEEPQAAVAKAADRACASAEQPAEAADRACASAEQPPAEVPTVEADFAEDKSFTAHTPTDLVSATISAPSTSSAHRQTTLSILRKVQRRTRWSLSKRNQRRRQTPCRQTA